MLVNVDIVLIEVRYASYYVIIRRKEKLNCLDRLTDAPKRREKKTFNQ